MSNAELVELALDKCFESRETDGERVVLQMRALLSIGLVARSGWWHASTSAYGCETIRALVGTAVPAVTSTFLPAYSLGS